MTRAVLVCSPNVGLLDNWLPVLTGLSVNHGYKFTVVFPTKKIVLGFYENETLISLSAQVFDEYIYKIDKVSWGRSTAIPSKNAFINRKVSSKKWASVLRR